MASISINLHNTLWGGENGLKNLEKYAIIL